MHEHTAMRVSRRTRLAAAVLPLAAALHGCSSHNDPAPDTSGASGSGGAPEAVPPPQYSSGLNTIRPAGQESGAGIWRGTLSRAGQVVNHAVCLLIEAGDLTCVFHETISTAVVATDPIVGDYYVPAAAVAGARGSLRFTATDEAAGSGAFYAAPGNTLSDGVSTVAEFAITDGSLTDDSRRLELSISSLSELSQLSAEFDHYYYFGLHGVSPGTAATHPTGAYAGFALFGDPASLVIDTTGALFSQSASGCVGSGQITIIEPDFNAYASELTMSDCAGFNGVYAGVAFFADFAYVNGTDDLQIAVFNGMNFIAGEGKKP